MSQSRERTVKICLNCGANLHARFCHLCGQENLEPRETVWGMLSHFVYDITHFDGKFFSTVKCLLKKPGFLSLEHMKGRRARYLHPIRLYVFTSAFFFIIFFSLFNAEKMIKVDEDPDLRELKNKREAILSLQRQLPEEKDSAIIMAMGRTTAAFSKRIQVLEANLEKKRVADSVKFATRLFVDSVEIREALNKLDSAKVPAPGMADLRKLITDSVAKAAKKEKQKNRKKNAVYVDGQEPDDSAYFSLAGTSVKYLTRDAYDAVQSELPAHKRHQWLRKQFAYKSIELNKRVNKDEVGTWAVLIDRFFHTFPQVLFISLPLFALLLQLLYIRHKKLFYVDHTLFSIHLYCATFIMLLVLFALNGLETLPYMGWVSILKLILYLGIFVYLYKAMRWFYGQGRFKTIVKFMFLNLLSFFMIAIISGIFFVLSVWRFK